MLKIHQALAARRNAILNGEKDDKGFTLIELLIVVLIIGVLAAIAIPVYLSTVDNTKKTAGQQTVSQMVTSITAWSSENGGAIPTTGDFGASDGTPTTGAVGSDDLKKSLPTDGNISVNYTPGTGGAYCIVAFYKDTKDSTWYSTGAAPAQITGTATLPTGCTAGNNLAGDASTPATA